MILLGFRHYEDYCVTRKDESEFLIREVSSDVLGLKQYRIIYGGKKVPDLVYSEGLDFKEMRENQQYLDAFREELLSQERLEKKKAVAKTFGINASYIGEIKVCDGIYVSRVDNESDIMAKIAQIKREHAEREERKNAQKLQQDGEPVNPEIVEQFNKMSTGEIEKYIAALEALVEEREGKHL